MKTWTFLFVNQSLRGFSKVWVRKQNFAQTYLNDEGKLFMFEWTKILGIEVYWTKENKL